MGSDQKRAILAVVISGVILLSWQYFFPAQPPVVKKENTVKKIHVTEADSSEKPIFNNNETISKEIYSLSNDLYSYKVSSSLSIIDSQSNLFNLTLSEVFSKNTNSLVFLVGDIYKELNFSIKKVSETKLEVSNQTLGLVGDVNLNPQGFLVFNLKSNKKFRYKFLFNQKEEELSGGKLKQFVMLGDDLETVDVGSEDKGDRSIKWFGIDFNYHLFAVITEKSPKLFNITESGQMSIFENQGRNQFSFKTIFAKKEYDRLTNLGDNLHLSVDFGFFSILATPILRGLQYFYGLIPNYGVAIIIITILMRLLTFPLQYKSYKSMKKMQEIQPELTKVKEKYKNDPQRMQQETMALFKKNGANPIGGCLPMILQMPIFFAFYRVLYNAVELVDAPFMLWITDLSSKDPYYVLPILMAAAMFFHQKLTPTTTVDPTQKKIMMFMPVIFALFMKDFPAGLTLYIFVSTVVAMLQQVLVYKKS